MQIVDVMCERVSQLMQNIHQLPFNLELKNGTLPQEKFIFYLRQDMMYLTDFSKALAIAAVKLPTNELMHQYLDFGRDAIRAERELHLTYIQNHMHTVDLKLEPTPACFMYTNYLLKMASLAPIEETLASLLPCFWVYQEVGRQIAMTSTDDNPYRDWINLYSSQQFSNSVEIAISSVNFLAENISESLREKMLNAFVTSTKLECLFWQDAYHEKRLQI